MFLKWKFLNSHWIEFTIQYGYMISMISLQDSWPLSHHSSNLKKYPIQSTIGTTTHTSLVLLHFLNSDFTNLISHKNKIHLFF
jgi:hypothetical protein